MLGPVTNMCWLCGLGVSPARDNGRSDIARFSTRTATGPDLCVRPMPSSTEFNCL